MSNSYRTPVPCGIPEMDAMYMDPICPGEMYDPPEWDDCEEDLEKEDQE